MNINTINKVDESSFLKPKFEDNKQDEEADLSFMHTIQVYPKRQYKVKNAFLNIKNEI